MKPITLLEQHKTKLLEMCKVLFPEYNIELCSLKRNFMYYETEDDDVVNLQYHNILDDCNLLEIKAHNGSETQTLPDLFIHWFEFCMNELYFRIYQTQNDTYGISAAHEDGVIQELGEIVYNIYKTHPVDYLYKEFKKLEK